MSMERESHVYMAKLAEQAERYDDAVSLGDHYFGQLLFISSKAAKEKDKRRERERERERERFHGGGEQIAVTLSPQLSASAARAGRDPLQADRHPLASNVGLSIRKAVGGEGERRIRETMEANAGMVAGSHKRNELVLIRHEAESGDAGVDWIIHLDTDELIYPAGAREYSLRQLLQEVPSNVDMVIFPNYESSIERNDIKDPFSEREQVVCHAGARRMRRRPAAANSSAGPSSSSSAAVIEEDTVESDEEGLGGNFYVAKASTKKEKKKQDREAQRQAEEAARESRKTKQDYYGEMRRKKDEEREAQERLMEEEALAKKAKEEEAAVLDFEKWKGEFSVDAEGTTENDIQDGGHDLLSDFVEYVKKQKCVPLEELAAEFKLRTQDCINRIISLENMGRLSGVMDDRGKYIYISPEEMKAVADYIRRQGRVSISHLASKSNQFIDLEPKPQFFEEIGNTDSITVA